MDDDFNGNQDQVPAYIRVIAITVTAITVLLTYICLSKCIREICQSRYDRRRQAEERLLLQPPQPRRQGNNEARLLFSWP